MKKSLLAGLFLVGLSGCVQTTPPLYYHGDYNKAVYAYFKGDDTTPQEQIALLEQIIQNAEANGMNVAPGIHAHLGLLYFDTGNADQGQRHFEHEKALFPESAKFLDFLLNSRKGA